MKNAEIIIGIIAIVLIAICLSIIITIEDKKEIIPHKFNEKQEFIESKTIGSSFIIERKTGKTITEVPYFVTLYEEIGEQVKYSLKGTPYKIKEYKEILKTNGTIIKGEFEKTINYPFNCNKKYVTTIELGEEKEILKQENSKYIPLILEEC